MSEAYKKLIKTLQNIFEMDKADLDFGIYRIMNQKRDEINKFLNEDLLPQVKNAFEDFTDDSNKQAHDELKKLIKTIEDAGMDPDSSPKVLELKKQISNAVDITALENDVFSKLHTFFSRYYDKGDFISQRRYKPNTYAIPYEGEEVKLYWANHDQYYIKSSEHLRDYAFIAKDGQDNDQPFRIKLVEADTEKDNIKAKADEERRFVLNGDKPLSIENGELIIHFNYIPVGKKDQKKLNEDTVKTIFKQTDKEFAEWLHILKKPDPTEKNKDRTLLEKHIHSYTARNTFDYFIHKNLGDFLRRELDFFIKNEVLHLDDIDDNSFELTEQQLRKIKILRTIAHKIIRMLAQIEDFQKKLWLKKKFIVETNYCITLDRIPVSLFSEIIKNEEQLDEWVRLFKVNKEYLKKEYTEKNVEQFLGNPEFRYLSLDTRFFGEEFKYQLLASIDDIDKNCDGLLVESDNFHALQLLQARYNNKVNCIHIDPPYNTNTSGFLYKNSYEHSSWLSMMNDRIALSFNMLSNEGDFLCHIDENEYERLNLIFDQTSLVPHGTIIWNKKNPMLGRKGIATQHEYIIWRSKAERIVMVRSNTIVKIFDYVKTLKEEFGEINTEAKNKFKKWISKQSDLTGGDKAYKYLDDDGRVFRLVAMGAPEKRSHPKFHIPIKHTLTGKNCPVPPNGWSRSPETISELINDGLIVFGSDETTQPQKKVYLRNDAKKQITSMYNDGKSGKEFLDALDLEFPYCHPVTMYEHLLSSQEAPSIFMDFFAGSGTNGHAVINISRNNNVQHKSILVEMGEQFNKVLKPRLLKVIYSSDWKSGKPIINESGISSFIKYIRLESYEDSLNNLILTQKSLNQMVLENNDKFYEDYLLGYWLDIETNNSLSLLNINKFENPFNYKLNISSSSAGVTKPITVDLIETFNYLIGLNVKTIDVIRGFKIITGINPKDETVLIVWRNIKEKDNTQLEEFLDKQGYNPRDTEFQHIYINGDHTLEDPHSKVKMIEIEFKRLMFDVKDI